MTQSISDTQAQPAAPVGPARSVRALGIVVLVGLLAGLAYVKWGASFHTVGTAQSSGRFEVKLEPYVASGIVGGTLAYLKKVWIALTFGILIGGTLRVAVSPAKIAEYLGGKGARSMIAGALAGAPLMLCSCCVTPIFSGLHKRGARLGPNLSVLFAAPGLNLAALALTFVLMPTQVAIVRVLAALALVFGVAPLIGRWFDSQKRAAGESETCAIPAEDPLTLQSFPVRWLKSVAYIAAMTLPIVVVGVALSTVLLPYMQSLSKSGIVISVIVTALLSCLIALPSFLEIPLALSLLAAGAPMGAAMALLVAGPVINFPSLLVLGREVGARTAVAIFACVWTLASLSGLMVGVL
jgi:uncharacterized protein